MLAPPQLYVEAIDDTSNVNRVVCLYHPKTLIKKNEKH